MISQAFAWKYRVNQGTLEQLRHPDGASMMLMNYTADVPDQLSEYWELPSIFGRTAFFSSFQNTKLAALRRKKGMTRQPKRWRLLWPLLSVYTRIP